MTVALRTISKFIFVVAIAMPAFVANAQAGIIAGFVTPAIDQVDGSVDLTAEGTEDWAYWERVPTGVGTPTVDNTTIAKADQKASPGASIGELTTIGSTTLFDYGGPVGTHYSWSDGLSAPTASGDGLVQAFPGGIGEGYRLTVPADTDVRRLRYYVGANAATGQLTATLSDGSAVPYVQPLSLGVGDTYVYDVAFRADSAGQTLTVDWVKTAVDVGADNIFVAAATLRTIPAGLRNAGFESNSGIGQYPPANDWDGRVGTAMHSAFPYGNNGSLGSSFGYTNPNDADGSQTVGTPFAPDTTYVFNGFGVDNGFNSNDMEFKIGYVDGSGTFAQLNSAVYDLDSIGPTWTQLGGVTYSTGASVPELGELITVRIGAVEVDAPGGGVFFDQVALQVMSPGLRNAGFESNSGIGTYPPADDWGGQLSTAMHSAFPYGNNDGLGDLFGFVTPSGGHGSQTIATAFAPNTEYVFDGSGVNHGLNLNDIEFKIGYVDDSGIFQPLDAAVYDLDSTGPGWVALDGATHTTGASGPEMGKLITVRIGAVDVDAPTGGVFFDYVSLSITPVPEPSTFALACFGLLVLGFTTRWHRR